MPIWREGRFTRAKDGDFGLTFIFEVEHQQSLSTPSPKLRKVQNDGKSLTFDLVFSRRTWINYKQSKLKRNMCEKRASREEENQQNIQHWNVMNFFITRDTPYTSTCRLIVFRVRRSLSHFCHVFKEKFTAKRSCCGRSWLSASFVFRMYFAHQAGRERRAGEMKGSLTRPSN